MENKELVCSNNHRYALSKKGTIHFLNKSSQQNYSKELWKSRHSLAIRGLFTPLLDHVFDKIASYDGPVLDVGCGEGSQLAYLRKKGLTGPTIGFDLSKEAINLAATNYPNSFWCVADLADSPFKEQSFSTILNILSPSNYQEFHRLLNNEGQLIKVIPHSAYLKELRAIFFEEGDSRRTYSNKDVQDRFEEEFSNWQSEEVNYTVQLDKEGAKQLIEMTPLSWNVASEKKKYAEDSVREITMHYLILIGNKSNDQ
ncbi:methyltransferase domain-containing protein [Lacticigenium naphthae]|uniref:methyltransferase domain-containing protein n=1 Tax=Lacticigenium naphthae TaxID=515351 RepID=UPI00146DE971|nr:methyltransferase domain-containing protein [Lacticigenium naphthae]